MTKTRLLITLLILLSWWSIIPIASPALQLEGVVLSPTGPVAGGVVTAYPDYTSLRNQQNGIRSAVGEKPGQYRLSLPQGKYYLVADGTDRGSFLFGYHGLNPVHVRDEHRWIPILVQPRNKLRCVPGYQGIGGRVLYQGIPATGSSVSVYAIEDEPYRGMGLLTNTVSEDGTFWFDLDPGTYVIIARKRDGTGAIGPIKKGDLICYFSSNPVQVPPAQSCFVDVSCYPRDDLDSFLVQYAVDPRGSREPQRRSVSLQNMNETDSTRLLAGDIGQPAVISGRVTDVDGMPLAELYISVYPTDEVRLFQMYVLRFKTEQMTRTNEKGFFRLEFNSGSYYLVAREKVGDAPLAGEYYGLYEGTPNHSISLQPGEIKTGVHISAEQIMP